MRRIIVVLFTIFLFFIFTSCKHTHKWTKADCYNPKICKFCFEKEGEPLPHSWEDANCVEPKRCVLCGKTEGERCEDAHVWIDATCDKAKHCALCGETEGISLFHSWSETVENVPSQCLLCGELRPLNFPKSGQIFLGEDLYRPSKLKIASSTDQSCYIKLKNAYKEDVFSFFVRAGRTVTVDVPSGYFYVYFSYGKNWYGTEYLFGSETTYAKDDEILDFENYNWEYTLYPAYDGNFSETPIDEKEFR